MTIEIRRQSGSSALEKKALLDDAVVVKLNSKSVEETVPSPTSLGLPVADTESWAHALFVIKIRAIAVNRMMFLFMNNLLVWIVNTPIRYGGEILMFLDKLKCFIQNLVFTAPNIFQCRGNQNIGHNTGVLKAASIRKISSFGAYSHLDIGVIVEEIRLPG